MAQRLGIAAAGAVAIFCLCYAIVLTGGLLTLPSPEHQIQEPWFTLMEVLIVLIAPAMLVFMLSLHAWVSAPSRVLAGGAVAFMGMCTVVTCTVHFAVLTLSHQPAFGGEFWARDVFSFRWPSVAYALDILAWDFFFPIAALFAGLCIRGAGLARLARRLMYLSAALALAGLAGVPLADMQVRNIGIVGYAVLFPVACGLMMLVFRQSRDAETA